MAQAREEVHLFPGLLNDDLAAPKDIPATELHDHSLQARMRVINELDLDTEGDNCSRPRTLRLLSALTALKDVEEPHSFPVTIGHLNGHDL